MKIIDCHSHFEPGLLDLKSLIRRMNEHGIDQTYLMSAMTTPPIYNKSNYLMGIQRFILNSNLLWPLAKKLDDGFHKSKGEWDPWYRKLLGKGERYKILQDPDNDSVFSAVDEEPERLKGWIFLNPKIDNWKKEFFKWNSHPGSIGVKIHPFWHRYSIDEAQGIIELCKKYNLPLMIHMGFDSLNKISSFIKKNNDLKVIFCHAAFPYYSKIWKDIKESNNKFIDLSSHHVDKKTVVKTVSYFGPERCLYGVDDPYGDESAGLSIQSWINQLDIKDSSKEKIFSKNILELINKK